MKILNLYAGIGGNRKLWGDEHEVTAIEYDADIANIYQQFYPNDTVIVTDAHQYLLDHHGEYDFIWSSPPCPSHSRTNTFLYGTGHRRYPEMGLYQEIIYLEQFFKGKWIVENVIPYYEPLIKPNVILDRHCVWSNFHISKRDFERGYKGAVTDRSVIELSEAYGVEFTQGAKFKRKMLRNMVLPEMGLHVFQCAAGVPDYKSDQMLLL